MQASTILRAIDLHIASEVYDSSHIVVEPMGSAADADANQLALATNPTMHLTVHGEAGRCR